ncbi:putative inactive 1-aminocyclopropane-1-carboxylate synthase-like protein 2 [Megaptera novaeangliae]
MPSMPYGQMRDLALRNRSIHTQLMETVLSLRQTVEDHIAQLMTRDQQQDLALEKQRHNQAVRDQEAFLGHLMFQMLHYLQSGATGDWSFQLPDASMDSRVNVRGGQQAQSSRQTRQTFYQRSDFEDTFISYDLSNRGIDISALYHSSFQDYNTYQGNKYHKDKNTLGYINLGTSENKICIDLLAERVVVLNGCSSVFSALAMVLCDSGEAFLVPTPSYGGFIFRTHLYAKVELVPGHLESRVTEANAYPFQLTVDKLEQALLGAKIEGKKVRGLVLINPQNPLGDVYSRDSVIEYLEFAKKYNLHVIIDEIYMLSVFDEAIPFHSVLSLESLPDPNKTHVIWGTSKDFGISGFCFGTLYTRNREVASAVSSFGYLHSISGVTQYKLCHLLQDRARPGADGPECECLGPGALRTAAESESGRGFGHRLRVPECRRRLLQLRK